METDNRPTGDHVRDHRAKNPVYRRAIVLAIEKLHDYNLRSNIDAIRRHVQSTLGPDHNFNDALFLKTMKALIHEGDIEPCTSVSYALTPKFKKRRADIVSAATERHRVVHHRSNSLPGNFHYNAHHEKESPAKKREHEKFKIIPKKIYDHLHMSLKNPMETDGSGALQR
eukprot:CAMPEP_0176062798 /NCGR_PEP_ID=MMETSP0120_2-20121206/31316_1 /TAXON_ID=160619 /ORGANISM="Kryptoperidinium foliaceum, Strain CCMP 1326" /LENGTH=169 /DNA_ID=CAMNT_0017396365 /DNA_START=233 /DNA_END=742 /DNA_ORIENTATION=-